MPNDNTRTVVDIDLENDDFSEFRDTDPTSEEVLYASRPGLWTGIEVMHSRHWLKRLRVDLKQHTILSHITEGADWQIRQEKRLYHSHAVPGNVALFSAGQQYDFTFSGREQEDIYVMFDPDFLGRLATEDGNQPSNVELPWQDNLDDPFIHHVIRAFGAEIRAGCPGGRLLGDSLGMALGSHLLARYATLSPSFPQTGQGLSPREISRVRDFVQAHLDTDLTVSELAQCVNLSPFHFSRLFRSATRISPYQYVIHERIERAKSLLLKGEMPLSVIAQETGFASQSHLNRHFKRVFGVAPRSYLSSAILRRNGQKNSTNLEDSFSTERDNKSARSD